MIRWPFTRQPTPAERIATASKALDAHRAQNLAKLNAPHAVAARKGWDSRRAGL